MRAAIIVLKYIYRIDRFQKCFQEIECKINWTDF